MIDDEWVEKLGPLVERDQLIREGLERRGVLEDTYHAEMEKVHLHNASKLKDLIKKKGFPVLSNAGEKGVRLSWLIVHHAISLPDFVKECLIQMRLAAAESDYPLELLACVEDRVAFFEGRGQLYGTSFDWFQGSLTPTLVEDPERLDFRRAAMGLPPMSETLSKISSSRPPKDPLKKALEFELWLKKTGWRI